MMINRYHLMLFLFPLFFISLLTGCSERIGPSEQKVALDFEQFINKQFQTVIQVKSFNVDETHQLSEDRVDIKATYVLQMDPTIEDKINAYRDPFGGYSSHPLKRFWRKASRVKMGHDEYVTLHYQLNEQALWIFQRMTPGRP